MFSGSSAGGSTTIERRTRAGSGSHLGILRSLALLEDWNLHLGCYRPTYVCSNVWRCARGILPLEEASMSEVESREEEILSGTITETNKAKDTTKVVQVVEGGLVKKDTFTRVSFASCGHLQHSAQDIGGKCAMQNCANISCIKCFRLCDRCGIALCPRHAKKFRDNSFCGSCHWKVFLFGFRGDRSQRN